MITRRRLLFTAGSGVLGVAVLNTVTACSSPSEGPGFAASGPPVTQPAGETPPISDWRRIQMSIVSAYLLVRGDEVAVVDLGEAGSLPAIESALKAAGSGWSEVRHIILTHQHPDHVGGLADVAPKVKAAVYAGEADLGGILSDKPIKPVKDGDEVFGLRIIGTPGHTIGHVSVYDPSTKTLVAGDALRTTSGLVGSDPQFTADPIDAAASVRKLATLDIGTILPGHGDPLTSNANAELRKLAAALPTS
jgi:glyoxylase-like metal-dependent hydrolase (beta-lactamase superfamily II)